VGWSFLSLKILHQNCDPELANDRSLPYTAYIVKYYTDEQINYDIVISDKKVDIFDHYWDKYREGLLALKQTEGRKNPRVWGVSPPVKRKEKK